MDISLVAALVSVLVLVPLFLGLVARTNGVSPKRYLTWRLPIGALVLASILGTLWWLSR